MHLNLLHKLVFYLLCKQQLYFQFYFQDHDLENRIGNITVAYTRDKKPIYAKDLNAHGPMTVLLKDAIRPNVTQTLENNPAIIHGGPFANIAHGCNSVLATKTALKLSDLSLIHI